MFAQLDISSYTYSDQNREIKMSAYSAVAAAFRYAEKESVLLKQAIQNKGSEASDASSASLEKRPAEMETQVQPTKRK